ncbi:hypothetical protein [uncultured Microbacterium sp.]|uniref:hypothetical protein n=1 Tax=uncultured Microbacterium sp. TaxID=191216 RepID=UPI0025F537B9|nr:hypothetical protein [uncultured Microbacterium sp.]
MLTINEPQVWTVIGVFATGMFGMITIVSTMFVRVVRGEIGGLRGDMGGLRAEIKGDIAELRTEIRSLDRDVNALMKHTFGIDRD